MPILENVVDLLKKTKAAPQTQVDVDKDGFKVPRYEKVYFKDIKSLRYLNIPRDDGKAERLDILLINNDVVTLNQEVNELIPVFDMKFEKYSEDHGVKNYFKYPLGDYRWKRTGKEYEFINEDDEDAYRLKSILPEDESKSVSQYVDWILIALIIIVVISICYFVLS